MKLAIFDMDGTLFDTTEVNYLAYKTALSEYGYKINREFFYNFCNGRNYKEFLPLLVGEDREKVILIHEKKKQKYSDYLLNAKCNQNMLHIVKVLNKSAEFKTALVTTASRENCLAILRYYQAVKLFDLIVTQEDVEAVKPCPDGFRKAMNYFDIKPKDTIVFEDSEDGIRAAKQSKVDYVKVFGYNGENEEHAICG